LAALFARCQSIQWAENIGSLPLCTSWISSGVCAGKQRWKRQHRHPALFLHTPWLLIKWEVLTFWRCVSRRSVVRLNNNMNPSDKCPIGCRITGFGLHNRSIEPPEESGRRRDGIKRRKFCVKLQRHQTEKDKIKLQERYRCFGVQRSEEQREKGKLELGSGQ
jgi:hypothetical protein